MAPPLPATTAPRKKHQRYKDGPPPHLCFEEEIIKTIYGPRLLKILELREPGTEKLTTLAKMFSEAHACTVDAKAIQHWLDVLGYKVHFSWKEAPIDATPADSLGNPI